jgi:hypothetical protein
LIHSSSSSFPNSGAENQELERINQGISKYFFANTSPADGKPQDASPDGDTGLYKVRYRYGPEELKNNSRQFCRYMVERAQNGVVYRKEDIDEMESQAINGDFAPKGKTKYSIWRWKGGAYCHHRWYRVIYFRKRAVDGRFLPKSTTPAMENDKTVSLPQARKAGVPEEIFNPSGWPDAATRPIDTPNRGKLN